MKIKVLNDLFVRHNEIDASRQSIWLIHGFADSGLAYKEVFQSTLTKDFNIYVVDMPGFGASPLNPNYASIKSQATLLSTIIQEETSNQKQVNLVAHSLGALIGTWICQHLQEKINYHFNIEGNLTQADSYFSSKPLNFETANEFVASFYKEILVKAEKEERYRRYYSSLRFADPEGMRNWSLSSQDHVRDTRSGDEFLKLNCNKLYIWGDVDTPDETRDFIEQKKLPNKLYPGVGHWHMTENPEQLYRDISELIKTSSH